MTAHFDLAVIGGGIVGLAHAWMGVRRGWRVVLLERNPAATGASVRNFGMIWPIGQPAGELHQAALRARELWLELGAQNVLRVETCGSLHLAHRADELGVQEEFRDLGTHAVELLTPAAVQLAAPLANPVGLLGGMFSRSELRVDPRVASARLAAWLQEALAVECHFQTPVVAVEGRHVCAADGRRWQADRIVVCSGSDLQTLYPEHFARSGLVLCKLQMLRTMPQPHLAPGAPHLASGLTLRHYAAFRACPTLLQLQARVATETPELDDYGIHVMASAFPNGEVILGDSHEYGAAISTFDKCRIEELIVRESRKVFQLHNWTMRERWHGIYARHPALPVYTAEVNAGTYLFVGTGGAGMTLSFGLAELAWKRWLGEA